MVSKSPKLTDMVGSMVDRKSLTLPADECLMQHSKNLNWASVSIAGILAVCGGECVYWVPNGGRQLGCRCPKGWGAIAGEEMRNERGQPASALNTWSLVKARKVGTTGEW